METNASILHTGFFYFDPEDAIYEDHFPGCAVVPGSLIIHAFMLAAGGSAGASKAPYVTNFRFKRFVSPGRYAYRIEAGKGGRMACFLLDEDESVVTGTL